MKEGKEGRKEGRKEERKISDKRAYNSSMSSLNRYCQAQMSKKTKNANDVMRTCI